jgi:TrmH family RNA methyltransferase
VIDITSAQNPKIKAARALRLRKHREREGRYLIEGIRIVEEALAQGAPLETLIYAPELLVSERAQALVERCGHLERWAVSRQALASLSDRDEPQGIAAVVRIVERSLEDIPAAGDLLVIVAYQLRDPGNLGAIIRTADAVGAGGVVIVEPAADLYDPQTVRATMGSLYALPIVRLRDETVLPDWYRAIRAQGLPLTVVGTSAHGERVHYAVDYRGPLALLLGAERDGLSEAARATCDAVVRLPMVGRATSLNVSAAAAALVYEVVRQRHHSLR